MKLSHRLPPEHCSHNIHQHENLKSYECYLTQILILSSYTFLSLPFRHKINRKSVHEFGDQQTLYYEARSSNHQELFIAVSTCETYGTLRQMRH